MAKGLPKSIIKKYGISKKAWEVFRGRKSRSRPSKVKTSRKVKKTLAKKRSYKRKAKKHRKKARRTIPLEVVLTGGAIPFTPARSGWRTPYENIQAGDYRYAMGNLVTGFTPFDPLHNQLDIIGYLNPFDFERGRYMKMLLYAGLASKVRKKIVRIPFDKIPIIGKYIS